jgi:CBS domain-containing protein
MNTLPVTEIMEREPPAANPDMMLTDLVALFVKHGYRALPVTDDEGHLLGVVSETDLFLKEHTVPFSTERFPSLLGQMIDKQDIDHVKGTHQMTVSQVMSGRAATLDESATMEDIALLMCARHLAMVPVVRGRKLVGVVRRKDLLKILYRT